jgi:hypothetical protein
MACFKWAAIKDPRLQHPSTPYTSPDWALCGDTRCSFGYEISPAQQGTCDVLAMSSLCCLCGFNCCWECHMASALADSLNMPGSDKMCPAASDSRQRDKAKRTNCKLYASLMGWATFIYSNRSRWHKRIGKINILRAIHTHTFIPTIQHHPHRPQELDPMNEN